MALTSQQCEFFHSFGYLVLPGLLADDVDWMAEEHGKVFETERRGPRWHETLFHRAVHRSNREALHPTRPPQSA